ncbi:TniB family NTP-binding protein [Roseateles sp. UC29_93]|uniref:TniB family NTP-binding protein n=1 Tax=Roseateles sp. UC29_93 TaxID=3350177 RepID=UPI003670A0F6
MSFDVIDPSDDWPEEERKVRARRMAMYSPGAIAIARDVAYKYILFPELKTALASFDRVYQLSRELGIPQGVLLSGPPGSSKTSIADYFMRSLPPTADIVDGFGALYVRMRPAASAGFVVSQVLSAVRHPFTIVRPERMASMRDIACEAMLHKGTRILFVDEAQCLAVRGKERSLDDRDTSAGNLLRELMDRANVALVLLADHRLQHLERVDRALADRVSVRLTLAPFQNDGNWGAFLGEFSRFKVIDLSSLNETSVRAATFVATAGCRRSVKRLITEAVLVAVDDSKTAVTRAHFRLAFERTSGPGNVTPNPYGES